MSGFFVIGVNSQALQAAIDSKIPLAYLDTDGTLAANSDTRVATQKAVKTYADSLIGGAQIFGEVPSGSVDGINTDFTLSDTPVLGSERIFLNGIRQKVTDDYTILADVVSFLIAPLTGSSILADYNT